MAVSVATIVVAVGVVVGAVAVVGYFVAVQTSWKLFGCDYGY